MGLYRRKLWWWIQSDSRRLVRIQHLYDRLRQWAKHRMQCCRCQRLQTGDHPALRRYNPMKLAEIDSLLVKYKGQEQMLYLNICQKYSAPINPQLTLPPAVYAQRPFAGGMQAAALSPFGCGAGFFAFGGIQSSPFEGLGDRTGPQWTQFRG